jgi:hypothetical protein
MSETAELMANRWWRQGDGDFLESIAETILAIEARLAALEESSSPVQPATETRCWQETRGGEG